MDESFFTESRPLIMRSNRPLGAALVERNLVKIEDLEAANEKLIDAISGKNIRQCSVLSILAYDLKVIKEDDILHSIVESDGIGLVDLRDYEIVEDVKKETNIPACWSTWTIPFDKEDGFFFLASAYYLSNSVRTYWEGKLGPNIIWYGTSLDSIAEYLEKFVAPPKPPQ